MLLVITGQTVSAPCPSDDFLSAQVDMENSHCQMQSMEHHCDQSGGEHTDCEQACKCCSGHCVSAPPSADGKDPVPARPTLAASYSKVIPSPPSETALRPHRQLTPGPVRPQQVATAAFGGNQTNAYWTSNGGSSANCGVGQDNPFDREVPRVASRTGGNRDSMTCQLD